MKRNYAGLISFKKKEIHRNTTYVVMKRKKMKKQIEREKENDDKNDFENMQFKNNHGNATLKTCIPNEFHQKLEYTNEQISRRSPNHSLYHSDIFGIPLIHPRTNTSANDCSLVLTRHAGACRRLTDVVKHQHCGPCPQCSSPEPKSRHSPQFAGRKPRPALRLSLRAPQARSPAVSN